MPAAAVPATLADIAELKTKFPPALVDEALADGDLVLIAEQVGGQHAANSNKN